MIANRLWVKLPLIEGRQGCGQALRSLLAEEETGDAFDNRGQRPACPVSDDGSTGGLRLKRRDAEVFLAGEEKGAAVRVIVKHFFVGEPPREADGRPGQPAQARLVATAANDDQRQLQPVACLNGEVNALVRDQAADDQEIVFRLR